MGVIDVSALTLNPEEATNVSEVIFEQVFLDPKTEETNSIEVGVKMDKFIPILGLMEDVGVELEGCDISETEEGIKASQKKWMPKEVGVRLKHCKSDLPTLLKFFKRKMKQNGSYDLVGSEELKFIEMRLREALQPAIQRIAWFGDTSADYIAGGGVFKAGSRLELFNMLDGLWKQIFLGVAGGTVKQVSIPENAGASYNAQLTLASDRAYKVMREIVNSADSRLKNDANAVIILTDTLADNWEDYLEDKSIAFSLQRIEGGANKLSFRGHKIVRKSDWDRIIQGYQDDGTVYNLPNRAVFVNPNNVPIGTLDTASLKEVVSFYDQKSRNNYVDATWTEDAKLLIDKLIVVAY